MAILHDRLHGHDNHADTYQAAWTELDTVLVTWPDRFIGCGSVPLGLPDEQTAALVEREVVGRGLRGIGELTSPPGHAGLIEPVLRASSDQGGLPVIVHGFAPTTADDLRTLATLARRHPRVPPVISQLGGLHWMDAVELVRDTPSMYLELSTAGIVFAVRLATSPRPARCVSACSARPPPPRSVCPDQVSAGIGSSTRSRSPLPR